jgi:phenylacetate-CoA ligase
VEVVDDAGRAVAPGGTGRLLVTHLRNALMPLIRYDTGDLAVAARAQACPCGRATPWVERLVGRARVEFHTTSGRAVEAYSLMRMCDLLSLSSYQLVQEVPGQLRVILEREAPVRSDLADVLGRQISAHAGEAFQVRVDLTGDFVLTELGKKNPTVRLRAP